MKWHNWKLKITFSINALELLATYYLTLSDFCRCFLLLRQHFLSKYLYISLFSFLLFICPLYLSLFYYLSLSTTACLYTPCITLTLTLMKLVHEHTIVYLIPLRGDSSTHDRTPTCLSGDRLYQNSRSLISKFKISLQKT